MFIPTIRQGSLFPVVWCSVLACGNETGSENSYPEDRLPVLLQCDPAVVDDTTRAEAVEILLDLYQKSELHHSFNPDYRKLKHPEMAAQIKPYISDRTRSVNVRYAAIDIAEGCGLDSLQDDLISVALDSSESYSSENQCGICFRSNLWA